MFQNTFQGPGGADYSTHTIEILLMLLVSFLLGLLLGYLLWYRYKKQVLQLEKENAQHRSRLTDLEKDFASLRYQYDQSKTETANQQAKIRSLMADNTILVNKLDKMEVALNSALAGGNNTPLGAAAIPASDDLKKIEGVGPKIEKLLHDGGIRSFRDLSRASIGRLKDILQAAGKAYQIHDPSTWPKQAEYAYNGQWKELKEYQDFLHGGKDPV